MTVKCKFTQSLLYPLTLLHQLAILLLFLLWTGLAIQPLYAHAEYDHSEPAADAVATTPAGSAAPVPSTSLQPKGSPVAPVVAAPVSTAETFTVTTDLLKATISAQGGDVVALELLRYKEHDNKDKTFVLFDAKHKYLAQAGLIGEGLPTHRSVFKRVDGATMLADGANELKLRLEERFQGCQDPHLQTWFVSD